MSQVKTIFLASILERYCLNPASEKKTYHLVIDLKNSNINYAVGDCLGIYPSNSPYEVETILARFKADGNTRVENRKGEIFPLREFLTYWANLTPPLPLEHSLDLFCKSLPPMLPRFYSIASSMRAVGQVAHLTIGLIDGLCSEFLCKQAPLHAPVLPLFHHPARNFSLNSAEKPIIMIGPGTGVAPFRGFMQERILAHPKAKNWLFFGERSHKTDFYYQPFWDQLVQEGQLILDCAFSRDQSEKIYVQHKMLEKKNILWQWLLEEATIYVCGDASKMAKDVDKALHAIAESEGKMSVEEARSFVKALKKSNRYLRDVY